MTYFTEEQVQLLLKPIHPRRVLQRDGMSYVEGFDIRAELTRVFGFGRWSSEVLDQALICETEVTTKTYTDKYGNEKGGKPAWYVVYRSRVRLTIHAPDGTLVTFHDGSHVGESTHPVHGEAHGNALTNSETYALRRAAINLGDQFGLSLYNKGSLDAIVRWTLVRPDAGAPEANTEDVPQISAEEPGSASGGSDERNAGATFDSAESADQEHVTFPRDVDEPEVADEARAAINARRAKPAADAGDPGQRPWLDMALETAAGLPTEAAAGKLWKESAAKAHAREITSDDAKRVQDLISARVTDLRKAEADEILKPLAADDPWRLKVEEISDEGGARQTLEELARAVTSRSLDMTRANRVSRAIIARFPKASEDREVAA